MKISGIERTFLRIVGPWIESPPKFFRKTFLRGVFRIKDKGGGKTVYLTFDDGPIPECTPWLLDVLDRYGIKATFFMVGDNVRKYPELYADVLRRGHRVGNHTMHHLDGSRHLTRKYVRDVREAAKYIESDLLRPPHGWMRFSQKEMLARDFRIIMYDLVTRDYSCYVDAAKVYENVRRYSRPGSIIVFHDSLKSRDKLEYALPRSIEWLLAEGYEFRLIPGKKDLPDMKKRKKNERDTHDH